MAWRDKASGYGSVNFADIRMNKSEQDAFFAWMKDVKQDVISVMQEVLAEGWKISLKPDFKNSCVICSLTMNESDHVNVDMVVSSRSDEPEEAFWISYFKVYVMYPGQRLPTNETTRKSWG